MGDLYSVLSELSLSGRAMLQCQIEEEPREVKNMKIKAQIVFYLSSIRFGVFWFGCVGPSLKMGSGRSLQMYKFLIKNNVSVI